MKTWAACCAALLVLAACGTPPPPSRLVYLPSALPAGVAPPAPTARGRWQLVLPVRVPDYLDRDTLLVAQGRAGLAAMPPWRWAEPLRESVPRVLRADLARLLGDSNLWTSPLPPGVAVQRQLRVDVLAIEAAADRREVILQARWTIVDPAGSAPPQALTAVIRAEADGSDGDALAAAHRLALWRLAERIAGT